MAGESLNDDAGWPGSESGAAYPEAVFATKASDWAVRGEGGANVVLGYVGLDHPLLTGKVLRFPKHHTHSTDDCKTMTRLVFFNEPRLHTLDRLRRNKYYAEKFIAPNLGLQYIVPQEVVRIPCLTSNRADVEEIGCIQYDTTKLIREVGCASDKAHVISIEIKPKCGFIPEGKTGQPQATIPKYILKQNKKLKMGQIKSCSKYNPLDLFSGEIKRMKTAFRELFASPQNNLRIFVDGIPLFSPPQGFKGPSGEETLKPMVDSLLGNSSRPTWEALGEYLAGILMKEGILSRILQLQQLDRHGIHAVHALWQELYRLSVEEVDLLCASLSGDNLHCAQMGTISLEPFNWEDINQRNVSPTDLSAALECLLSARECGGLKSSSNDLKRKNAQNLIIRALLIIQDYLMAATAKDCSIFVTIQAETRTLKLASYSDRYSDGARGDFETNDGRTLEENQLGMESFRNGLFMISSDKYFIYKVWVADLDFKDVGKILKHFQLSEELDSLYANTQ